MTISRQAFDRLRDAPWFTGARQTDVASWLARPSAANASAESLEAASVSTVPGVPPAPAVSASLSPVDDSGDAPRVVAPLAMDIVAGKNDPIYNDHPYHTKVPHRAIMRHILHHTRPGDVVLDGFCGSGMTGVAAQLCGDPDTLNDLGLSCDAHGQLRDSEGRLAGEPGPRRALLADLSPLAGLLAYHHNRPLDPAALRTAVDEVLDDVTANWGWLQTTLHQPTNDQLERALEWLAAKTRTWPLATDPGKPSNRPSNGPSLGQIDEQSEEAANGPANEQPTDPGEDGADARTGMATRARTAARLNARSDARSYARSDAKLNAKSDSRSDAKLNARSDAKLNKHSDNNLDKEREQESAHKSGENSDERLGEPSDHKSGERSGDRHGATSDQHAGGMPDGLPWAEQQFTVWSDEFECPRCGQTLVFFESAVDQRTGRVNDPIVCRRCRKRTPKRQLRRVFETVIDPELNSSRSRARQTPVRINYEWRGKRYEKVPDAFDIALHQWLEATKAPFAVPSLRMPPGRESRRNDAIGITHVHQFYPPANLWLLGALAERIAKLPDRLRQAALLIHSAANVYASRLRRFRAGKKGGGPLSGTLYVSSLNTPANVLKTFERNGRVFVDSAAILQRMPGDVRVSVQSSTQSLAPPGSIDYVFVDPPFGGNIMYAELNFLWEAWLGVVTDASEEAVENPATGKGLAEYERLLGECFRRFHEALKPGGWMTVVFHHADSRVWNAAKAALDEARFAVRDVRTLDKCQDSFKQINNVGSVKYDLLISAERLATTIGSPPIAPPSAPVDAPPSVAQTSTRTASRGKTAPQRQSRAKAARVTAESVPAPGAAVEVAVVDAVVAEARLVAARGHDGGVVEAGAVASTGVVVGAIASGTSFEPTDESNKASAGDAIDWIWEFVDLQLANSDEAPDRVERLLYSRLVAECLCRGRDVPLTAAAFYAAFRDRAQT
ncbi:MAG: hypothetical protein RLY70_2676 [Planctomycetota bacterium]